MVVQTRTWRAGPLGTLLGIVMGLAPIWAIALVLATNYFLVDGPYLRLFPLELLAAMTVSWSLVYKRKIEGLVE